MNYEYGSDCDNLASQNISVANILQNILIFILFSIYFFLSSVSSTQIIEIVHNNTLLTVLITLFNIIINFFYFMFWIVCLNKNSCFFSKDPIFNILESPFKRFCINKILILLFARIVCDCLVISLTHVFGGYTYIISNVLSFGFWIFIYYYLTDANTRSSKYSQAIVIIFLLILLTIFIYLDFYYISELNESLKRYISSNNIAIQMPLNYEFLSQSRSVVLNILFGLVLYVSHVINFSITKSKWSSFFTQFMLVCMVFGICFAARFTISKYNCVIRINNLSSYGSTREKDKFIDNYNELTVKRITPEATKNYEMTFHSIKLNGKTVKKFSEIKNSNHDYSFEFDGVTVKVFSDNCICFVENSKPNVILYKDLASIDENAIVTQTLRELIYSGNLSVIEYGYDYLMKYDTEFIHSIIELLNEGTFTREQIEYTITNRCNRQYYLDFVNRVSK